jgi:hypothetical protein
MNIGVTIKKSGYRIANATLNIELWFTVKIGLIRDQVDNYLTGNFGRKKTRPFRERAQSRSVTRWSWAKLPRRSDKPLQILERQRAPGAATAQAFDMAFIFLCQGSILGTHSNRTRCL